MSERVAKLNEMAKNVEGAISNYTRKEIVKPDTTNRDILVAHVLCELAREEFDNSHRLFSVTIAFPKEILQKLKWDTVNQEHVGFQNKNGAYIRTILEAVTEIFPGHNFKYEHVCTNADCSFATITLDFEADKYSQSLFHFRDKVNVELTLSADANQRSETYADIAKIKGYMVSINDKLNEVSAVLNDARREIVAGIESTIRTGGKLLDLVTPLTKSMKPKVGKKEK